MRLGGATVDVHLSRKSRFVKPKATLRPGESKVLVDGQWVVTHPVAVGGCTSPPRKRERVAARVRQPASGLPQYAIGTTDDRGCYELRHQVEGGGEFDVTTILRGSRCYAPLESKTRLKLPGKPFERKAIGDESGVIQQGSPEPVVPR